MKKDKIREAFDKKNINYTENCPLQGYSSFNIGGVAEMAVFPKNKEELIYVSEILRMENTGWEIIGKASNILFDDGCLEGVFIFTSEMKEYFFDNTRLVCLCGASLTAVARKAVDMGLGGLEFAYGIPGSVGGAVYMNAGAYGSCVSEVLCSSSAYNMRTGEFVRLDAADHNFGYRESVYMERQELVCLEAEFELYFAQKEAVREKMEKNMSSRKEKQPLEYPSAGSYFKRPVGNFAGKLIEDCGLKGFRVGGACVSGKHAGFIVNLGGATASDVLELEKRVRERVFEKFGVVLEREVRFISSAKNKER